VLYRCRTGLFIGINEYVDYSDHNLKSAEADASRLHEYFKRACPAGRWELLVDDDARRPLRVEILDAVQRLVVSVGDGEAGLLFCACHAETVQERLVLCCADYRPSVPIQSGIALEVLLELMRVDDHRRFLVILACCRTGELCRADLLPSNVCIIYSCQLGGVSLETANAGFFATSLLNSMDLVASRQGGGAPGCNVQELHAELEQAKTLAVPSPPEMQGTGAAEIRLPLNSSESPGDRTAVRCAMRSVAINPATASLKRSQIGDTLMYLMGLPSDHKLRESLLAPLFVAEADSSYIEVCFDSHCFRGGAWLPIQHLLHQFPAVFEQLYFVWAGRIRNEMVRKMMGSLDGIRMTSMGKDMQITWPDGSHNFSVIGMAQLCDNGTSAIASLNCQNREGGVVPLNHLQRSLEMVFKRFVAIPVIGQEDTYE
jgi:Caspase domain